MAMRSLIADTGRRIRYEYDRWIGGFPEEAQAWGRKADADGGMSNEVWFTEDDDIAKAMNPLPGTALITAGSNTLRGTGGYPSARDRIENEAAVSEAVGSGTSLETPTVYDRAGYVLRMERQPHQVFKEWAETVDQDRVGRAAERLGSDIRRLHNAGYALTDARIENLGIDEDRAAAPGKPVMFPQDAAQIWFDFEYAKQNAATGDRLMDYTTLLSSARHLDPDRYEAFRDGFETGYGEAVPEPADALANITSKIHARYLEQEPAWEKNAYRNVHEVDTGVWSWLHDTLDAVIKTDATYRVSERLRGYTDPWQTA